MALPPRINPVLAGSVPMWGEHSVRVTDGSVFVGELDAWDVVYLNGVQLPGLCTVRGKALEQKVKTLSPPGTHGRQVNILGREPAQFEIQVAMWERAHLEAFQRLIPSLKPSKPNTTEEQRELEQAQSIAAQGANPAADQAEVSAAAKKAETLQKKLKRSKAPRPVDVRHPALNLFGIRGGHVLSVTLPEPKGEGGQVYVAKLSFLEYVPKALQGAMVGQPGAPAPAVTGLSTVQLSSAPPSQTRKGPG